MAEKVVPLTFNPHTDDLLPSIIVSDTSAVFVPDRKINKSMNKFFNANPNLNQLIFYLRTTIIQEKITETQMVPYKRGDIVNNDIIIEERIDILGSTELVTMPVYHHTDFSAQTDDDMYNALDHSQMLLDAGPPVQADDVGVGGKRKEPQLYISAGLETTDSGSNYLTLLKDERVKANSSCIRNQMYCLDELHFKGGHGEVYRAHRISDLIINKNVSLILKRMFIKDRPAIERCAYREIFYGTMLTNNYSAGTNVARFQSYFTTADEIWLVFLNEGASLQSFLYTFDKSELGNPIMRVSQLWISMKKRTDNNNRNSFIRVAMYQLIKSVAELHDRDIIHRDLKPGNIIINSDHDSPRLLLVDFSSAIGGTDKDLYGGFGPSVDEETLSYAPPEVLLSIASSKELPFDPTNPKSYDAWSCGIIMLELILGTSNVFSLSESSTRKVSRNLQKTGNKNNQKEINDAMLTEALKEYCIINDLDTDDAARISHSNDKGLTPVCNMADAIFNRDPLKIGFRDHEGIDLLLQLLQFDPLNRIPLKAALEHAYFKNDKL